MGGQSRLACFFKGKTSGFKLSPHFYPVLLGMYSQTPDAISPVLIHELFSALAESIWDTQHYIMPGQKRLVLHSESRIVCKGTSRVLWSTDPSGGGLATVK